MGIKSFLTVFYVTLISVDTFIIIYSMNKKIILVNNMDIPFFRQVKAVGGEKSLRTGFFYLCIKLKY